VLALILGLILMVFQFSHTSKVQVQPAKEGEVLKVTFQFSHTSKVQDKKACKYERNVMFQFPNTGKTKASTLDTVGSSERVSIPEYG